jgi:hypothetical protein
MKRAAALLILSAVLILAAAEVLVLTGMVDCWIGWLASLDLWRF